jgi:hypothetical protein
LSRARELNAILSELFVENMICANEAMIAWVEEDLESAKGLLKTLHQKSNDDFFNDIDSSMNLLFIEDTIPLGTKLHTLDEFIKRAQEQDYKQCILRGHWYKWALKKRSEIEDPFLKDVAINYAVESGLDWGVDCKRVIYLPWYAGIFV